jgi:hypothetical protein
MTDDALSAKERAALLGLMAMAREISNPEFRKIVGFALDGKERRRLNERKLVTSELRGRSYVHELTDPGWRWCEEELSAGRPPRAGYLGGACYALLANLSRFLDRADLRLADIFGRTDEPLRLAPPPTPSTAPVTPDGDIESRIRSAYRQLAREPRDWVRLAESAASDRRGAGGGRRGAQTAEPVAPGEHHSRTESARPHPGGRGRRSPHRRRKQASHLD